jgi:hypothetical protein
MARNAGSRMGGSSSRKRRTADEGEAKPLPYHVSSATRISCNKGA